jgi:hypothetical protein
MSDTPQKRSVTPRPPAAAPRTAPPAPPTTRRERRRSSGAASPIPSEPPTDVEFLRNYAAAQRRHAANAEAGVFSRECAGTQAPIFERIAEALARLQSDNARVVAERDTAVAEADRLYKLIAEATVRDKRAVARPPPR